MWSSLRSIVMQGLDALRGMGDSAVHVAVALHHLLYKVEARHAGVSDDKPCDYGVGYKPERHLGQKRQHDDDEHNRVVLAVVNGFLNIPKKAEARRGLV